MSDAEVVFLPAPIPATLSVGLQQQQQQQQVTYTALRHRPLTLPVLSPGNVPFPDSSTTSRLASVSTLQAEPTLQRAYFIFTG